MYSGKKPLRPWELANTKATDVETHHIICMSRVKHRVLPLSTFGTIDISIMRGVNQNYNGNLNNNNQHSILSKLL